MTSSRNTTLTIESKVGGGGIRAVEASLQDSSPRAVVLNTHSHQTSCAEEVKGRLFFSLLQPS